jgi:hypothetical protein
LPLTPILVCAIAQTDPIMTQQQIDMRASLINWIENFPISLPVVVVVMVD